LLYLADYGINIGFPDRCFVRGINKLQGFLREIGRFAVQKILCKCHSGARGGEKKNIEYIEQDIICG
jgi:hypothetical protein